MLADLGSVLVDGLQELFGFPGSFFFLVAGLVYGSASICPGVMGGEREAELNKDRVIEQAR